MSVEVIARDGQVDQMNRVQRRSAEHLPAVTEVFSAFTQM
jgi:hypothetical protein